MLGLFIQKLNIQNQARIYTVIIIAVLVDVELFKNLLVQSKNEGISMTTTTVEKAPEVNSTKIYEGERCDDCGAKAVWLVYFTDSELAWCNHHYVKFESNFAGKLTIKIND